MVVLVRFRAHFQCSGYQGSLPKGGADFALGCGWFAPLVLRSGSARLISERSLAGIQDIRYSRGLSNEINSWSFMSNLPDVFEPDSPLTEMLVVEFLYDHKPTISKEALRANLRLHMPDSELVGTGEQTLLIAHNDCISEFTDGKVPAQTAVLLASGAPKFELFRPSLMQTFGWSESADIVRKCTHMVLVTELMSRTLEPQDRVRVFHNTVATLLATAPPLAIRCLHSHCLVNPQTIKRCVDFLSKPDLTLVFNIRMFKLGDTDSNTFVMDTCGLATLGLPDLQVHFQELDTSEIATFLYNLGHYIFQNGDCIEDGHTVQGLSVDQRWRCQHEMAMIGPKRIVVDVDSGEFAAGDRNREAGVPSGGGGKFGRIKKWMGLG